MEITFVLSASLMISIFCLAWLLVRYAALLSKHHKHTESDLKIKERAIEDAEEKAEAIIEKATDQAGGIVENMSAASRSLVGEISDLVKSKTEEVLGSILTDIKISARGDIENFKLLYAQKLSQEIEKIETDLAEYKKTRRANADKEATEAVKGIIAEALDGVLDESLQEKVIKSAVEKALKEGVFNK